MKQSYTRRWGAALVLTTVAVLLPAAPATAADARGTLRAWGFNSSGQLGDGTTVTRLTPTPVVGLTGMRDADAGSSHNLALGSDNTVWAWGANRGGQLGDGTTIDRPVAVRVTGLAGVTAVSAGGEHSLAVTSDGTVWAWGRNNRGQLGDGTTVDRTRPVRVLGLPLPAISRISAGDSHSGVVLSDGSVWMWGLNANGQLGDGTRTNRARPVRAQVPGQAVRVEAGFDHTLASHIDRTVFSWGDNSEGQLGDGTTTDRLIPARVPGLANVVQISAGAFHNLARNNTALAWGRNTDGQLGDGTRTSRTRPVRVTGLVDPVSISAGAFHSLAREFDTATPIRAWGSNSDGQLGDGTRTRRLTPVVVPAITSSLVDISAGSFHTVTTVIIT